MKVILYMAISTNGMIAKSDDDTSWISKEEWDSYSSAVRAAGCLVVGRRTYDILTKQPEFSELCDIKLIAVSEKNFDLISSNHLIAYSPREALELLKDFKEVVVAGGGHLNASFMKENLVDEIFLDIEPIVIGKGVKLFENQDFEVNLKLTGVKNLSPNEVQLHYQVTK